MPIPAAFCDTPTAAVELDAEPGAELSPGDLSERVVQAERRACALARGLSSGSAGRDWAELVALARACLLEGAGEGSAARFYDAEGARAAVSACRILDSAAQFAPQGSPAAARRSGLLAALAFASCGNFPSSQVAARRTFPGLKPRSQEEAIVLLCSAPSLAASVLLEAGWEAARQYLQALQRFLARGDDGSLGELRAAWAQAQPEVAQPLERVLAGLALEHIEMLSTARALGGGCIEDSGALGRLLEDGLALLLPPQREALSVRRLHEQSANAIVALPPGTGKTLLGELCALQSVSSGEGKGSAGEGSAGGWACFVVPYVALGRQVAAALERHAPPGVKVCRLLGGEGSFAAGAGASVVVSTPERLDALLRSSPEAARGLRLVVCDEAHGLSDEARGVQLEGLLSRLLLMQRSSAQSSSAQGRPRLVLLSAAVQRPRALQAWLGAPDEAVVTAKWCATARRLAIWRLDGTLEWHSGADNPPRRALLTSTKPSPAEPNLAAKPSSAKPASTKPVPAKPDSAKPNSAELASGAARELAGEAASQAEAARAEGAPQAGAPQVLEAAGWEHGAAVAWPSEFGRSFLAPRERGLRATDSWVAMQQGEASVRANISALVSHLHEHFGGAILCVCATKKNARQLALSLAAELPRVPVGPHTQRAIELIAKGFGFLKPLARALEKGAAWHHAGLPHAVREAIEAAIKSGEIATVASTTTLAEGVDFPFRWTILVDWLGWSGSERAPLSRWLLRNIVGRCGRAGAWTEGDTIIYDNPLGDRAFTEMPQRARWIEHLCLEPGPSEANSALQVLAGPGSPPEWLRAALETQLLAAIGENSWHSINEAAQQFADVLYAPHRKVDVRPLLQQTLRDWASHDEPLLAQAGGQLSLTPLGQAFRAADLSPATARRLLQVLAGDTLKWQRDAAGAGALLLCELGGAPEQSHHSWRKVALKQRNRFPLKREDTALALEAWLSGHAPEQIFALLPSTQNSARAPRFEDWLDGGGLEGNDAALSDWYGDLDKWAEWLRALPETFLPFVLRACAQLAPIAQARQPQPTRQPWLLWAEMFEAGLSSRQALGWKAAGAPGTRRALCALSDLLAGQENPSRKSLELALAQAQKQLGPLSPDGRSLEGFARWRGLEAKPQRQDQNPREQLAA